MTPIYTLLFQVNNQDGALFPTDQRWIPAKDCGGDRLFGFVDGLYADYYCRYVCFYFGILIVYLRNDYYLIISLVPILPDYLIRIKESNDTVFLESSLNRSQVKNFSDLQTQQSYHEAFISNSIPLSMLMGSKSAAQIITNFCVGHLTYK